MSWLENKYVLLLSNRFERFTRKSSNLFNMRCRLCGDSEKNKNKARAYIYEKDGRYSFHCHNCNASMPFEKLLKTMDSGLFENYLLEKMTGKNETISAMEQHYEQQKADNKYLKDVTPLMKLDAAHAARSYMEKRLIPAEALEKMYYTDTFKAWTHSILSDKYTDFKTDESRIIIPLYNQDKKLFGYQGRSVGTTDARLRYITIIFDHSSPKIFGLDTVNFNKRYYVFEGPLDSLFIENSIATAGGKLSSELLKIGCSVDKAVMIHDNEKRNKAVVKAIEADIRGGFVVFVWPSNVKEKDINDMIVAGYSPSYIKEIIDKNTFKGLEALTRVSLWKNG